MNFLQLMDYARKAAQILPIASQIAISIQAVWPADAPGAAKLAQVKDSVAKLLATQNMLTEEFNTIWPFVSPLLESIIGGFKANSLFGFKPSTTSTPAPGITFVAKNVETTSVVSK